MKYVAPCSILKSIMCPSDAWLYTRGMQMEKIDGLKLKKYIEMNFEKTLKVMRNMSKRLLSDYKTI